MPHSNSNWLPQSASECTVSASIELDRVKYAATPLLQAMAKLAPSANRIARVESPLPAMDIPLIGAKTAFVDRAGQSRRRSAGAESSKARGRASVITASPG